MFRSISQQDQHPPNRLLNTPNIPTPEAGNKSSKKKDRLRGCRLVDSQHKFSTQQTLDNPVPCSDDASASPSSTGGLDSCDARQFLMCLSTATKDKLTINVPEMAKLLSISKPTAYALARSDGFPAFMVGNRTLVSVPGLIAWVEQASAGGCCNHVTLNG